MTDDSIEAFITRQSPPLRPVVRRLRERVRAALPVLLEYVIGPYEAGPKKTSIHFMRRDGLAGIHPRKNYLVLNLRTDRPIENPRVIKCERVSSNRYHDEIKLSSPDDVDDDLVRWLREA